MSHPLTDHLSGLLPSYSIACCALTVAGAALAFGLLAFYLWDISPASARTSKAQSHHDLVFSATYFEARRKFRAAAIAAGAALSSKLITVDAETGLELTMEVAVLKGSTERVLVHTSGVHGVEGYCGSAVQVRALLDRAELIASGSQATLGPHDPTIIFVHAVNPFGFAHDRRFNESNVDLNRNCLLPEGFAKALSRDPNSTGWERFRHLLLPLDAPHPLHRVTRLLRTAGTIARTGMPALRKAFISGQYHEKRAPYYGGTRLERSWLALGEVLAPYRDAAKVVVAIDVHTGLGPSGIDTLMVDTPATATEAKSIWPGARVQCASVSDSKSDVAGGYDMMMGGYDVNIFFPELPSHRAITVTEEFGTRAPIFVGRSVIEENAAYLLARNTPIHRAAREMTRNAFYVETPQWKEQVLRRGAACLASGYSHLAGLSL